MGDSILLASLAAFAGAPLALAPVTTAIAVMLCVVLIRSKASRGAIVCALAILAINGLRARAALSRADAIEARAVALARPPSRCIADAVVVGSPMVVRQSRSADEGALGDARADVEMLRGECDGRTIEAPIRARLYGSPEAAYRGDRVRMIADVAPLQLFANEELSDPRPPIARSGVALSGTAVAFEVVERSWSVAAMIDRARAHARRRIDATFDADANPLARALVLGEADLDPTDDEAFRTSGLAHLLAVSGTHLVIAVLGFAAALRAVFVRVPAIAARMDASRIVAAITIPVTWLYADFAGGSGSAIRAAAMLSVAMIARVLGRRPSPIRSFALSMGVSALVDPLVATDISFVLSVASTAGLMTLQRPIAERIAFGPKLVRKLISAIATTIAATVGCAPVLALLAPSLPALNVPANLIAAPLGELAALPLCFAQCALGFWPAAERGAALAASGALLGVRFVARASAATGAIIAVPTPTNVELAVLGVGCFAIAAASSRAKRIAAAASFAIALGLSEIAATRAGCPRGSLRVTVLDVGQGDSLLVDLPDGKLMLVDGGGFVGSPIDPGTRVLLPVLRMRRRSRVDIVVLSHPHPDHFTGLASALPRLDVGELWDTGQGEAIEAGATYAEMLRALRSRRVPIRRPAELCGAREIGGAAVAVLAPCPTFEPDAGPNDNSFVLRVSFGSRSALLVGDAERAEERKLLDSGALVASDFLKVGHHGSRTSSSPAFLDAVHPSFAVISTGVRNRFGHPHAATLAAFASLGGALFRTDRDGEVIWETDGSLASARASRDALRE